VAARQSAPLGRERKSRGAGQPAGRHAGAGRTLGGLAAQTDRRSQRRVAEVQPAGVDEPLGMGPGLPGRVLRRDRGGRPLPGLPAARHVSCRRRTRPCCSPRGLLRRPRSPAARLRDRRLHSRRRCRTGKSVQVRHGPRHCDQGARTPRRHWAHRAWEGGGERSTWESGDRLHRRVVPIHEGWRACAGRSKLRSSSGMPPPPAVAAGVACCC